MSLVEKNQEVFGVFLFCLFLYVFYVWKRGEMCRRHLGREQAAKKSFFFFFGLEGA